MRYAVEITDVAFEAILGQARYIAVDRQAPLNARRWIEQVWDVIDDLEHMPARHNLAPEDAFKTYEVRRAVIGDYFILFTIDEDACKVWVIGARHGSRRPRPEDLPETLFGNEK
ncbi:MAG TPA: type II toxin-antitoxin system RelE/ParE family toxin [Tepidisphaeraceae bacterium]|nr:type II toxin-antitoxin system RelE/ParE family toxin [Tepidisphaeraceae bacterium]